MQLRSDIRLQLTTNLCTMQGKECYCVIGQNILLLFLKLFCSTTNQLFMHGILSWSLNIYFGIWYAICSGSHLLTFVSIALLFHSRAPGHLNFHCSETLFILSLVFSKFNCLKFVQCHREATDCLAHPLCWDIFWTIFCYWKSWNVKFNCAW